MQFISTLNIFKEEEKSQQYIWVKEKIKFMRNELTKLKLISLECGQHYNMLMKQLGIGELRDNDSLTKMYGDLGLTYVPLSLNNRIDNMKKFIYKFQ